MKELGISEDGEGEGAKLNLLKRLTKRQVDELISHHLARFSKKNGTQEQRSKWGIHKSSNDHLSGRGHVYGVENLNL
jgi:ribosomal protein L19E